MRNAERITWIDTAKAFGIIYVVVGHVLFNESIKSWLIGFHMPLFIFLSGYLFNDKDIIEVWKSKTKSMIRPYCFFSIVSILYYWVIECRFRNLSFSILQSILGGVFCYIPYMNNAPLWYLPCAYIVVVAYALLRKKLSAKLLLVVGALANTLYWAVGMDTLLYKFPYELPRVLDLFVYYCIGAFVAGYKSSLEDFLKSKRNSNKGKIFFCGISVAFYSIGFLISQNQLYKSPGFSIVIAMLGIMGTVFLSCLTENAIIRIIGKGSLFILCTHAIIYRLIIGICSRVLHLPSVVFRSNIILSILVVVTTIISCLILEVPYNRIKIKVLKTGR